MLRLFCFAYAGGGSAVFRQWGQDLGPVLEVCCVQLPGRENRFSEPPYQSMSELIPPMAEALAPWLDRPYAFYGHSFGARIAFEGARALRRTGRPPPAHLFAAASPAPQMPWPYPGLSSLGEGDFLAEIHRRYAGIPERVFHDPEIRALFLPTLRADIHLLESYIYEPGLPLGCGITVIGGSSDRLVTVRALEPWRQQTCQECSFHMFEGDHFFLQSHRAQLLALISKTLARFCAIRSPRNGVYL